uniref:Zinc-ribbon domain-containing protein n=1 Tax=Candidatus Kentrum eta TaxID=2126337 RepID=A0A450V1Q7_9GAMM|nr:MAG: hypothetical protein BECKH772A_GA0070896_101373 [Candidatus Kentron sp. H]VFJ98711.1 MAG: hypothetical protein BECKH772B_GA0070898_101413 [Candidatus Kentron sp. H]VFK03954.1 MAG: hypothetical protein BECKH772C_GA0070978_101533 [Candidatus Kentron sp. H]
MKIFHCHCGQLLSFDNTRCLRCGEQVGYDPLTATFLIPEPASHRHCASHIDHGVCNWLVAVDDPNPLCLSCRMTRTIPDLSRPGNLARWVVLEGAKRRLLYNLLQLQLPIGGDVAGGHPALAFQFLEDRGSNPMVAEEYVRTGHASGVITINVMEADNVQREITRSLMNEAYRTPLGHCRHESGHYYFDRFLGDRVIGREPRKKAFIDLFGDPHWDYAAALAAYYAWPPTHDPEAGFISPYAQSHPLEDWAECWAHYLHIIDTLETAVENGIALRVTDTPFDKGASVYPAPVRNRPDTKDFDGCVLEWQQLAIILNELNRSMGLIDAYPFVLTPAIIGKLRFIHTLVHPTTSTPSRRVAAR